MANETVQGRQRRRADGPESLISLCVGGAVASKLGGPRRGEAAQNELESKLSVR